MQGPEYCEAAKERIEASLREYERDILGKTDEDFAREEEQEAAKYPPGLPQEAIAKMKEAKSRLKVVCESKLAQVLQEADIPFVFEAVFEDYEVRDKTKNGGLCECIVTVLRLQHNYIQIGR